ncbi:MAG: LytR/AlgR family response regulator transcription factor [Spirosomataceae bacterium]
MYKVAIIEDNAFTREHIKDLFATYFPRLVVVVEAFRIQESIRKLVETPCDIVLMDIELRDGSGFDILKTLNERGIPKFKLILFSKHQHSDYLIRGMNFEARHYLFKPIHPDSFQEAITLVLNELEESNFPKEDELSEAGKLVLRLTDKSSIVLLKSQVLYVASLGQKTVFHTQNGSWETPKHLGAYEFQLEQDPFPFLRIHQSYFINIQAIEQFFQLERIVSLVDGTELPVARRNIRKLKSILSTI